MPNSAISSPHTFHIPVMGTGFTIDTPLMVAKYGISSAISMVDDILMEQMRKYWCEQYVESYVAVDRQDIDARAKRITAYLNLINKLVNKQVETLRNSDFTSGSEISNYYEMLPAGELKQKYLFMLAEKDKNKQLELQNTLRKSIIAGDIDVNIMTKQDRINYRDGEALPYEFCDAASALRGFANSELSSSLVLSAGFNPYLFGYISKFADFLPNANGELKKKICLKVSDYRSAAIQGKYLAKHGIWVSEFSIESPLNCGGHAFVNDGELLGPILEEFKDRREELVATLHKLYLAALESKKITHPDNPYPVRVTVQGGIGTHEEHEFLRKYYQLDSVGWGSPFLMVPEVTNVDKEQLKKLQLAKDDDIFLSFNSPLGVPFWNLRNSASEEAKCRRIKEKNPGSDCIKGFGRINYEFTKLPICRASRDYQKHKLAELQSMNLSPQQLAAHREEVLNKSCICHDLAGGATIKRNIDPKATSAICPGPNIINFKKIMTLKEMVNHIYGRDSVLTSENRPHLFVREIQLHIDFLLDQTIKASFNIPTKSAKKLAEAKENLLAGIQYYQRHAKEFFPSKESEQMLLEQISQLQAVC